MNIFGIIIYIFGVMASLLLMYYKLDKGYTVKIIDLCIAIMVSILSWVAVFIIVLFVWGDKEVFKKK